MNMETLTPFAGSYTLTGAQAAVRTLVLQGARHIFGLPGNQLHFYDAIERSDSLRHVLVRHEQAAAHMADSYSRVTGQIGICEASAGPGASNLVTGLAEAYASSIAVLALVTTTRSSVSGRANFQELDLVSLFGPVAKRVLTIDRAERVPEILKRAVRIATSGKPGPVVIVIHSDVHSASAVFDDNDFAMGPDQGKWPAYRTFPDEVSVQRVIESLRAAKRPLLWAGGGILSSQAQQALQNFAELTGTPVVTTYMGKGSISEQHALAVGPIGQLGRPSANEFVRQADLVIAIGTRFTNLDTAGWTLPPLGTKLIHVDIDPEELGRHFEAEIAICSDANAFLERLIERSRHHHWPERSCAKDVRDITAQWRYEQGFIKGEILANDTDEVHPLEAIRAIRTAMKPSDVIICDSGFNQIWGGQYFEVHQAGRQYIGPRGMGVMGFSFPAAIAARLADPSRRYVALCGDGGFMMLIHELETSLRLKAPVVVCVLNNRNLEYCTQIQRGIGGRPMSTEMLDTDFAQVARAFGCRGERVRSAHELAYQLEAALSAPITTVLDIVTPSLALPDGVSL